MSDSDGDASDNNSSSSRQSSNKQLTSPDHDHILKQTPNATNNSPIDETSATMAGSGPLDVMRDTANEMLQRFHHDDEQTTHDMEQNLQNDDDALIRAYGEEETDRLLQAEHNFAWAYFAAELQPSSYVYGLMATFGSLFVFRRAPTFIRSIRGSASTNVGPATGGGGSGGGKSTSGYKFDQFPSGSAASAGGGGGSRMVKSMRFAVEFTVSSLIGLNVFDIFLDRAIETSRKHVPDVPLVEGISLTSKYKCPAYMKTYGSAPSGFWREYRKALDGEEEEDEYLRTELEYYEKWAINCARREAFEERLRQTRNSLGVGFDGTKSRLPTPIPSPGVPKDYPVNLEDIGKRRNGAK